MQRKVRTAYVKNVRLKYRTLRGVFNERQRRLWAATEARSIGFGGIACVADATGLSRTTIAAGLRELEARSTRKGEDAERVRRPGGGRKSLTYHDPELPKALDALIEPTVRGDPQSPLRWTCTSSRELSEKLTKRGHPVSPQTVRDLLRANNYSLQANRKAREGKQHPDRDAQFRYINRRAKELQRGNQPVISVDTKKKELIGDFKNKGRRWRPKGKPDRVRIHDFIDEELGKVIPYGIYDITANAGWVSVGVDHDTAEFAVASIRRWWMKMGRKRYPKAKDLMVTADAGGSNGYRIRLWKVALQCFADESGLRIRVCHFPPGTSKWNKIEHKLFSFITKTWEGQPLLSRQAVVELIGKTRTKAGLVVRAALDKKKYRTGVKITDEEMASLNIAPARIRGDWNYTVTPRT